MLSEILFKVVTKWYSFGNVLVTFWSGIGQELVRVYEKVTSLAGKSIGFSGLYSFQTCGLFCHFKPCLVLKT
jgi:hypothetical protein